MSLNREFLQEYTKLRQKYKFTDKENNNFIELIQQIGDQEKQLSIYSVMCSDFKTVITEFETNNILYESLKIFPVKKNDNITINGNDYEVSYVDWNFDKGIFEICVWQP